MSRWIDLLQDLNFHQLVAQKVLSAKQGEDKDYPLRSELEILKLEILSREMRDIDTSSKIKSVSSTSIGVLSDFFNDFMRYTALTSDEYIIVELLREKEKYPYYPDYVIVKNMHYYVNDELVVNSIGESPAISYENIICCWSRSPDSAYPSMFMAGLTRIYCKDGMLHREIDKPAIHSSYGLAIWEDDNMDKPLTDEEYRLIKKNPNQIHLLLKTICFKDSTVLSGLYFGTSRKSKPNGIFYRGYKEHWDNDVFKGYSTPGHISQFWQDHSTKEQKRSRNIYDFVDKFKDEIDPFSNEYYLNKDVEFMFMADLG